MLEGSTGGIFLADHFKNEPPESGRFSSGRISPLVRVMGLRFFGGGVIWMWEGKADDFNGTARNGGMQ